MRTMHGTISTFLLIGAIAMPANAAPLDDPHIADLTAADRGTDTQEAYQPSSDTDSSAGATVGVTRKPTSNGGAKDSREALTQTVEAEKVAQIGGKPQTAGVAKEVANAPKEEKNGLHKNTKSKVDQPNQVAKVDQRGSEGVIKADTKKTTAGGDWGAKFICRVARTGARVTGAALLNLPPGTEILVTAVATGFTSRMVTAPRTLGQQIVNQSINALHQDVTGPEMLGNAPFNGVVLQNSQTPGNRMTMARAGVAGSKKDYYMLASGDTGLFADNYFPGNWLMDANCNGIGGGGGGGGGQQSGQEGGA